MTDLTDQDFVARLNAHLGAGGVIAFPTDTVWGLGARPTAAGRAAIFRTKRRPADKPLTLMSDSAAHIRPHMRAWPDAAHALAARFWPGALTIGCDGVRDDDLFGGVRVPNYAPFQELCRVITGHVLLTSSANVSGAAPLDNTNDIRRTFPDVMVIDNADRPMGGAPSTVVVVTDDGNVRVVRAGAVKIN